MAYIICVEGPDRVGKATQTKLLVNFLTTMGFSAERVEVPYKKGWTYSLIYKMLKTGLVKVFPTLFQTIQFLNRRIFQKNELPKMVESNDFIVFDRWSGSSYAYGLATGVNKRVIEFLMKSLVSPDVTIVLDGESHVKEYRDSYEKDRKLQHRVRELYKEYVSHRKCCATVIDAEQDQFEVLFQIVSFIENAGLLKVSPKATPNKTILH